MGRHSPSHSSRRRSGSRSPKRHRDRHDRKHKEDRKGSNLKGMEETKRRMREGLDAAATAPTMAGPTCAPRPFEDLSHAEQASRAREIERIDEGGFQQSQFKSGNGGRVQKKHHSKAEKVDAAQAQHEKAIFGPAWMNKQIKKEELDAEPPLPSAPQAPSTAGPPRLHTSFTADPQKRSATWLNIWKEQRRTLGVNC